MADHIDGPLYYETHGQQRPGHGLRASQPDGPVVLDLPDGAHVHLVPLHRYRHPGLRPSPKARDGLTMSDMAEACWEAIDDGLSRASPPSWSAAPSARRCCSGCTTTARKDQGADHVRHRLQPRRRSSSAPRIKQYTGARHRLPLGLHLRGLQPGFPRRRRWPMYFADLFADRNAHADLDTIITQFQAYRQPEPEDHHGRIELPIHHPQRQRGQHAPDRLRAEEADRRLRNEDPLRRGPCLPDRATWLFDRYMIEFLNAHGLFPAPRPGLSSILLGSA